MTVTSREIAAAVKHGEEDKTVHGKAEEAGAGVRKTRTTAKEAAPAVGT